MGRVDTAHRHREFYIVSILPQSGSQATDETYTGSRSLHRFTRCTLFYSVYSVANHLHKLLCSTEGAEKQFRSTMAAQVAEALANKIASAPSKSLGGLSGNII